MLRAYDDSAFIRAAAESKLFSRDAFEHLASFDPGEWVVNMIGFHPTSFIWDPCVQFSTFKNQPSFDVVAFHFSFKDVGRNCFSRGSRSPQLCLEWGCGGCQ